MAAAGLLASLNYSRLVHAGGTTGRKVLALLSQAHVEPDLTVEMFFVDGPLEGFGVVELVGST
jgi:hypothetical protein